MVPIRCNENDSRMLKYYINSLSIKYKLVEMCRDDLLIEIEAVEI